MRKEFWLERWARKEIGFHEEKVNAYLIEFWHSLNVDQGAGVFIPLCGKSLDMQWLREQGHMILGVELSSAAVQSFFQEQSYILNQNRQGKFDHYSANDIHILCGDFFDLNQKDLASIKAVYDRASLVALPPEMRERYVSHLVSILTPGVRIFLVTFDYMQAEMQGPPFAVSTAEVQSLYGKHADIILLAQFDVLNQNPRFKKKGLTSLNERIFLLTIL